MRKLFFDLLYSTVHDVTVFVVVLLEFYDRRFLLVESLKVLLYRRNFLLEELLLFLHPYGTEDARRRVTEVRVGYWWVYGLSGTTPTLSDPRFLSSGGGKSCFVLGVDDQVGWTQEHRNNYL